MGVNRVAKLKKKKRKTIIISLIWQFYFLTTFFRYVERRREEQSQQKQKRFFFHELSIKIGIIGCYQNIQIKSFFLGETLDIIIKRRKLKTL